jgi:hypothetical protein
MTSPRIEQRATRTDTLTMDPPIDDQPAVRGRHGDNDERDRIEPQRRDDDLGASAMRAWHQLTGDIERVATETVREQLQPVKDCFEAIKQTAKAALADPGDQVRTMEDGDTVVVEGGLKGSAHVDVGASGSTEVACAIERRGDEYTATFQSTEHLGVGLGAEGMDNGGAADLTTGQEHRLVVKAHGPAGRDALADLVAGPLDGGNLRDRLDALDTLEVARVERVDSVGLEGTAGVGFSAGGSIEGKLVRGTEFENGVATDTLGAEMEYSVSIETPGYETDPEAAAQMIKSSLEAALKKATYADADIPVELIENAIRANGGLVGLEVGVTITGRLETIGDDRTTVQMVGEAHLGGTTHSMEARAEVHHDVDAATLRRFARSGDVTELIDSNVTWGVETRTTEFEGFEIQNMPLLQFRNGIERNVTAPDSDEAPRPEAGRAYQFADVAIR